ncbi:BHMT [Mytilus coruscus]|uniref:BHMT n=1 Tax=Mytilus coruscus TaxID=42192 RepID=A0A6J8ENE7_MYTCO|nr:BHMT [Mytilus coruscus]
MLSGITRLKNGENILIAEGYLFEFGRRGYLKYGANTPEVVVEHPELVEVMHEEFVHAGSDVVEAFTYYGHREKLKIIGREHDLEELNKTALRIAKKVARKHSKLFAFGLCNSTVFVPGDEKANAKVRDMFKEQIEWAVEEGVDYIIGETFNALGEAMLALECIKEYGKGVPAVITIAAYFPNITTDDVPIPEACRLLEENGAAVVGLNCARGPATMLPLLREIRKTCKGPIAALPVPFRCTDEYRTFQSLKDPKSGKHLYMNDLESVRCSSADIRLFAHEAKQLGVQYIGLCCGNFASYFRELAEVYGRTPLASNYSPDMSMNSVFGDEETGVTNALATKMKEFTLGIKQ